MAYTFSAASRLLATLFLLQNGRQRLVLGELLLSNLTAILRKRSANFFLSPSLRLVNGTFIAMYADNANKSLESLPGSVFNRSWITPSPCSNVPSWHSPVPLFEFEKEY